MRFFLLSPAIRRQLPEIVVVANLVVAKAFVIVCILYEWRGKPGPCRADFVSRSLIEYAKLDKTHPLPECTPECIVRKWYPEAIRDEVSILSRRQRQGDRLASERRRGRNAAPSPMQRVQGGVTPRMNGSSEPPSALSRKTALRVPFDRVRLKQGLEKACWKRPISDADIESVLTEVENYIEANCESEVESRYLGEIVNGTAS